MRHGSALLGLAMAGLVFSSASCSRESQLDQEESDPPASTPASSIAQPVALVGDSSVGCLTIRAPIEAVRLGCNGVTDTVIRVEGQLQPAVEVSVEGGRAMAEIVDGRVWRIRVSDPSLQTADSIRVGTPVSRLAGHPGFRIVYGEGTFARMGSHCGKSFEIQGLPLQAADWTVNQLLALPDTVRVIQIVVVDHCDHR